MTSFVYILRTGSFAKVGFSKDPEVRLRHFQIALPEPASIVALFEGGVALENKLHRHLAEFHLHDEWFRWCEKLDLIVNFGLPDLSDMPPGSPFYPGRHTEEYRLVREQRVAQGLAHDLIKKPKRWGASA